MEPGRPIDALSDIGYFVGLVENGFVIGQSKKMVVSYQNICSCMYFTVKNDVKKLC